MGRSRRNGEAGQGLVEFAMVLPLLLVIVCAIIDFGRVLQAHVSLTNAVREGARLGAVGSSEADVEARVAAAAPGLDPIVNATVPSTSGASVTVDAEANVVLVTPLGRLIALAGGGGGAIPNSFTISAAANMRRE